MSKNSPSSMGGDTLTRLDDELLLEVEVKVAKTDLKIKLTLLKILKLFYSYIKGFKGLFNFTYSSKINTAKLIALFMVLLFILSTIAVLHGGR